MTINAYNFTRANVNFANLQDGKETSCLDNY